MKYEKITDFKPPTIKQKLHIGDIVIVIAPHLVEIYSGQKGIITDVDGIAVTIKLSKTKKSIFHRDWLKKVEE